MSDVSVVTIRDTSANPAPLGLLGFGMTTVLLNLHNIGLFSNNTMIMAMGIFVGGIAQIIAGILEAKKKNTFGTTAFIAYGSFWLSLVALWVMPKLGLGDAPTGVAVGSYMVIWWVFTFGMFIATLKLNRLLQVVFLSLAALFLLLAIHFIAESALVGRIAGWVGLFCGLSAIYGSLAQVINEVHGKVVLPIGELK